MNGSVDPAHPDAIAGVTVVHHHEVIGLWAPDYVQMTESQHDPVNGSNRVLLVFNSQGTLVARFEPEEWHVATAPGDFGCGSGDVMRCDHCHGGRELAAEA